MTLNRSTNFHYQSMQVIPQKRSNPSSSSGSTSNSITSNSTPAADHASFHSHPNHNQLHPSSLNSTHNHHPHPHHHHHHHHNHNHNHAYHPSRPSHLDPSHSLPHSQSTHHATLPAQYDPRATIVLIGMRGVGKTTLGLIASTALSRRFIDTDSVFETLFSTTIGKYVSTHGWADFRIKESEVLTRVLKKYPKDAVISCGGGIVDSTESRELLKGWKEAGPVILVLRERDEVLKELSQEREKEKIRELSGSSGSNNQQQNPTSSNPISKPDQRPDWGEAVKDVWRRREPFFWECSSHAFVSLTAKSNPNPFSSPVDSSNASGNDEGGIISKENPATSLNPISQSRSGTATPVENSSKENNASSSRPMKSSSGGAACQSDQSKSDPRTATTTSRRLPNHPLALKPVEESFLRLIKFILSDSSVLRPTLEKSPTPVSSRPSSPVGSKPSSFSKRESRSKSHKSLKPRMEMPGPPDVTSRSSLLSTTSSFLSLSFPDFRDVPSTTFSRVIEGVDCLEIRADLLDCLIPASTSYRQSQASSLPPNAILPPPVIDFSELALQVETIRYHSRGLPILFTVRSQREGGAFHDDRDHKSGSMKSLHSESLYFKLLDLALKMGIEIIDVEMAWSPSSISSFLSRRGRTRCKLSYHDLSGALRWDSNHSIALYERASNFGADLVGLYGFAKLEKPEQNWHLLSFQAKILSNARNDKTKNGRLLPPLTAINMGDQGRVTRTFNPTLTPVAHPAQPTIAAPGQMSVRDIGKARSGLGFGGLRRFYLFFGQDGKDRNEGDLVKNSLEAGVSVLGLPHFISFFPQSSAFALHHCGNDGVLGKVSEYAGQGKGKEASGFFPKVLNLPLEFENEEFGGAFFGGSGTSLLQERLKGWVGGVEVELESEEVGVEGGCSTSKEEAEKDVLMDDKDNPKLLREGGFLPSTRDSDLVGAVDLIVRLENNHGLLPSVPAKSSSKSSSKTHGHRNQPSSTQAGTGANPAGLHDALSALAPSTTSSSSVQQRRGSNPTKDPNSGNSSPSTPQNPTRFISNPNPNRTGKTVLADHTLPKSIERLIYSNLSPINAPGPTSSALIVILDQPHSHQQADAGKDVDMDRTASRDNIEERDPKVLEREKADYDSAAKIAAKASIMAVSRLGFGKCVVAELKDDDEEDQTGGGSSSGSKKEASWIYPDLSQQGEAEEGEEWWAESISNSILEESLQNQSYEHSSVHVSSHGADAMNETNSYKCQPFFLGIESLRDLPHALVEASSSDGNGGSIVKPGRPASVIIIIGGSEESRKKAVRFLDSPPEMEPIEDKVEKKEQDQDVEMSQDGKNSSSSDTRDKQLGEKGVLPSEIWESPMGGVVFCVPCSSSPSSKPTLIPSSTSNPSQASRPLPYSSPSLASASHPALCPSLHRNGWLILPNRLMELERLSRGVFEPWNRKRAPRASMARALEG